MGKDKYPLLPLTVNDGLSDDRLPNKAISSPKLRLHFTINKIRAQITYISVKVTLKSHAIRQLYYNSI